MRQVARSAVSIIITIVRSDPNSYTKQRKDVDVLIDRVKETNKELLADIYNSENYNKTMRRDDRFRRIIASTFKIDVLLFLRARLVIKEILTSRRNLILLLNFISIIEK